jgi:hypothetical protein
MKTPLRLVMGVLLLLLAACGNQDQDNETSADVPDVSTLLPSAAAAIADVTSLRFTLDVTGTTNVDTAGTIQLLDARGTLARPDKVDVQFQVRVLGAQTVSIRMITIADESWTTDLITGKWGPAPREFGYDPGVLFDTENGLAPVINAIRDPRIVREETIDDVGTWKVEGSIDEATIGPVTGETMQGTVLLGLWIDKETNRPVRFRLQETDESGKEDPATWTMDLGNFDEPVTIEPPE